MKTSVIITSYNYAEYLPKAIESVLNQTVPAHELIVVDDGSTDGSQEIINSYGDQVIALFQHNSGQASAISNGYAHATGDIIMLLDADDVFHPHKIEILQEIYKTNPDINWVFHDLKEVYKEREALDGIMISKEITPKRIDQTKKITTGRINYNSPATSGLTFRNTFMKDFFPMPQAGGIDLSDHYIKFYCLATSPGLHISEPLGLLIVHDRNLYTGKSSSKALATRARIFANTAMYLEKIAPHTEKFCQNLMGEALSCARQAGIYNEISEKSQKYLDDLSWAIQGKIKGKAFLKSVLQKRA